MQMNTDTNRPTRASSPISHQPTNSAYWASTGWPSLACLLLLLGGLSRAPADTYVCGTVYGTWTKADSPYILTCNVQAVGLTIQPGVTVSASNYTFEVDGVLTAIGTETDPIVFNACNPAVGWQGIFFNQSAPGSQMSYCIISNAVNSGVRIVKSLPAFDHCTFANNTNAAGSGGAIYADLTEQTGDLVLHGCTITNNTALHNGGGIYGAASTNSMVLACCLIQGNSANPSGGAGLTYGGGVCVDCGLCMMNCSVLTNWANAGAVYGYGGGVYVAGPAQLNNCLFRGNVVNGWPAYGGAMFAAGAGPLTVINSVFSDNTCSGSHPQYCLAGGLYIGSGVSSAQVVNCTFAYNNREGLRSDSSSATLLNSILFFNAGGGTQIVGTTNVTYCDVQNGYAGAGNISSNPGFCSTANLELRHCATIT